MPTIDTKPGMSPAAKKTALVASVLAVLGPAEGMRQVAYRDPPGILTVCEGHTDAAGGAPIDPHHVYTIAECKKFAQADALHAVETVQACAPADIPDRVAVAFSDAVFNLGQRIACDRTRSTAARMLYAHNWAGACAQLTQWDKATVMHMVVALPGLTKRRALERSICEGAPSVANANN